MLPIFWPTLYITREEQIQIQSHITVTKPLPQIPKTISQDPSSLFPLPSNRLSESDSSEEIQEAKSTPVPPRPPPPTQLESLLKPTPPKLKSDAQQNLMESVRKHGGVNKLKTIIEKQTSTDNQRKSLPSLEHSNSPALSLSESLKNRMSTMRKHIGILFFIES